jgi:hypothetical protein
VCVGLCVCVCVCCVTLHVHTESGRKREEERREDLLLGIDLQNVRMNGGEAGRTGRHGATEARQRWNHLGRTVIIACQSSHRVSKLCHYI